MSTDIAELFETAVETAKCNIRKLMTLQLGHFNSNDCLDDKQIELELKASSTAVSNVSNIIANAKSDPKFLGIIKDKWQPILDELQSKLRCAINRHTYKTTRDANTSKPHANLMNGYQSSIHGTANVIQDAELAELGVSIEGMQSLACAVNKEVYSQNDMLAELDEKVDFNSSFLNSISDRMSHYLRTRDPSLLRLVFYLICLSCFLVFVFLIA